RPMIGDVTTTVNPVIRSSLFRQRLFIQQQMICLPALTERIYMRMFCKYQVIGGWQGRAAGPVICFLLNNRSEQLLLAVPCFLIIHHPPILKKYFFVHTTIINAQSDAVWPTTTTRPAHLLRPC